MWKAKKKQPHKVTEWILAISAAVSAIASIIEVFIKWGLGKGNPPLASIINYLFEEVKNEKDFNLLFRFSILFFVFSFDKICPVIVEVKRVETQTFLRMETAQLNAVDRA